MEEKGKYEADQPARDDRCPDCGCNLPGAAYGQEVICPGCKLGLVYAMVGARPGWIRADDQSEPNAPGPEQEEPQQEPPESILQVRFAGPGLADIASMQTQGHVTLGQLAYLGTFLVAQAFTNWQMPAIHEVVKATMMQVLTEAFKPKIEPARAGFRIPPDMLRND